VHTGLRRLSANACPLTGLANLTREDADQFLRVAAKVPLRLHIKVHRLADANRALGDLRAGVVSGAAVLVP
jgi:propanol-preferring alcohol dehydrogenase